METEHRFTGVLSEEYNMVKLMIPHYDEHEDTVRQAVETFAHEHPTGPLFALDIGCGTGLTSECILEADPGVSVVGIDNEPVMIAQARERLARFRARVDFCPMDAHQALRASWSNRTNIIASGCVLHNLSPKGRRSIMRGISEVLQPGGLFVNADKLGLDDPIEHARAFAEQLENLHVFDGVGRPDLREAWHAHYLEDEEINFTEAEQKTLLSEFGFENIQTIYRNRLEATVVATKI